jgi:hypothetical protein
MRYLFQDGFRKPKKKKQLADIKKFNNTISLDVLKRFGKCEPVKINENKWLNIYRAREGVRLEIEKNPSGNWQPGHKLQEAR